MALLVQLASIFGCAVASMCLPTVSSRRVVLSLGLGLISLSLISLTQMDHLLSLVSDEAFRYAIAFLAISFISVLLGAAFPFTVAEMRQLSTRECVVAMGVNSLGVALGTFISIYVAIIYGLHANLFAILSLGVCILAPFWFSRERKTLGVDIGVRSTE